jgi:hypothetical protein
MTTIIIDKQIAECTLVRRICERHARTSDFGLHHAYSQGISMKLALSAFAALLIFPSVAQAQSCDALIDQTIVVSTFEDIVGKIPHVEPKGEFETTAQFEARKASASVSLPTSPFFVNLSTEVMMNNLKYDADRGVFRLNSYTFNASSYDSEINRGFKSPFREMEKSNYRMVGVKLKSETKTLRSYEASNGFGAVTVVNEQTVTNYELFEGFRHGSLLDSGLWEKGGSSSDVVGEIAMPPAEAQLAKPHLRAAIMFFTKDPYYIDINSFGPLPTRDSPYDITYRTMAIVGDMQCALIYDDRTMKVAWSRETY